MTTTDAPTITCVVDPFSPDTTTDTAAAAVTPIPEVTRDAFGVTVLHRDTEGRRHRLDGPAEYDYDSREEVLVHTWYRHGFAHRDDGPARVSVVPDGMSDHLTADWYQHSLQHRAGGPAITLSDGDIFWFVEGHNITSVPPCGGSDQ